MDIFPYITSEYDKGKEKSLNTSAQNWRKSGNYGAISDPVIRNIHVTKVSYFTGYAAINVNIQKIQSS